MYNDSRGNKSLLTPASSIEPEEMSWLWPGFLVRRAVNILAGRPGMGKTTLAIDLASIVSNGGSFPDGTRCEAGNVIIFSTEDDVASVLRPKLDASGADIDRIFFLGAVGAKPFDPRNDKDTLIQEIERIGGVQLVIVDPILSGMHGNSNHNNDVRAALEPLREIAVSADAAVIGIAHLKKSSIGTNALERICGAGAFGQVARCASFCVSQPIETNKDVRGLLVRIKANYGVPSGGYEFSIVPADINAPRYSSISKIRWGDEVRGKPEALIVSIEGSGDAETDGVAAEAKVFLKELLKADPLKSVEVFSAGSAEGFSKTALNRAKRELQIKPKKTAEGWIWQLKS